MSLVKNLGVLNGSLGNFAGFIIRERQSYFKVVNCYSTGTIGYNGGGIAGGAPGLESGYCQIINCYSTGSIGLSAGGIVGTTAGWYAGTCVISNCYSTGSIGPSAGGIAGAAAGYNDGNCTISNCYSTGSIGISAGGIVGVFVGYSNGNCTISNCYSTSLISQPYSGGIVGSDAIQCTISNCVSNSPTIAGFSGTSGAGDLISTNNSNDLSTLNTVPSSWNSNIWATGLSVTVGPSSYTLPILKEFQAAPWITTSTNTSYYNQATDAAVLFLSPEYTMSAPQHQPITVNLNVNVDASGNIEVFGQEAPVIINKVVASYTMPPVCLYEREDPADNYGISIFEFWEPSDALGTRKARRAVDKSGYNGILSVFGYHLSKVLTNSLNAIDADPFNQPKYTSTPQYYTHDTFGRLALSSYAHYLFGHVAATAAITNDGAFMATMNAYTNTNNTDFLYNTSTSYNSDVASNNIAKRIVDKIAKLTDAQVLNIVEQVIGQDASRAMGQDNSSSAPDVKQPLKFYNGDKIYVNINLQQPTVSVLNNEVAQKGEPEATKFGTDAGDTDGTLNRSYTIEITLNSHVTLNPTIEFDPTTRFGTINLSTGPQFTIANSSVADGTQNIPSITFYDDMGNFVGTVNGGTSRSLTSASAILATPSSNTGFAINNSSTYNSYFFINPFAYIHRLSFQGKLYIAATTNYTQVSNIIPIGSTNKITLPAYDFTVTGWSTSGPNRRITFTSSNNIPAGFRLGLVRSTNDFTINTGIGTSYTSQYPAGLSDGTMSNGTLVFTGPSGNPLALRTTTTAGLATTIVPGKTYTFETGEGFFTANTLYRFILTADSVGTASITGGYIRFGGSYMFGFNTDGTILMY